MSSPACIGVYWLSSGFVHSKRDSSKIKADTRKLIHVLNYKAVIGMPISVLVLVNAAQLRLWRWPKLTHGRDTCSSSWLPVLTVVAEEYVSSDLTEIVTGDFERLTTSIHLPHCCNWEVTHRPIHYTLLLYEFVCLSSPADAQSLNPCIITSWDGMSRGKMKVKHRDWIGSSVDLNPAPDPSLLLLLKCHGRR